MTLHHNAKHFKPPKRASRLVWESRGVRLSPLSSGAPRVQPRAPRVQPRTLPAFEPTAWQGAQRRPVRIAGVCRGIVIADRSARSQSASPTSHFRAPPTPTAATPDLMPRVAVALLLLVLLAAPEVFACYDCEGGCCECHRRPFSAIRVVCPAGISLPSCAPRRCRRLV